MTAGAVVVPELYRIERIEGLVKHEPVQEKPRDV